jgi:hypothetical protein
MQWLSNCCKRHECNNRRVVGSSVFCLAYAEEIERESIGSQLRIAVVEVRALEKPMEGKSHWKPLPGGEVKTVTVNTSLCVIVNYKV